MLSKNKGKNTNLLIKNKYLRRRVIFSAEDGGNTIFFTHEDEKTIFKKIDILEKFLVSAKIYLKK